MDPNQTGVTNPAAEGNDLDLDNLPEGATVPVSVVKAIRSELQEEKASKQQLQDRLAQVEDTLTIYRMQLNQAGAAGQQAGQKKDPDPLEGMEDDDVLTVGQARKLMTTAMGSMNTSLAMRELINKPDFTEVTQKHLPNVLRTKPHLAQLLASEPNEAKRWALAYEFGQTDPEYQKAKITEKVSEEAKKVEANLKKPGSPSGKSSPATMADANRIANMSSAEFREYRKKVLNG
ncbi:MAG: hypothetical protein PHZ19_08170 [Candidatus Thermoplasmatota archaeon]|nr:hypothetical protein [Candidatus Thermoplasmatota archaeon]